MSITRSLKRVEDKNGFVVRSSPITELRGYKSAKVTRHYPRGFTVFDEGQRLEGVYLLCEGRAKVSVTSAQGKTFLVSVARPGNLLGVNAVLMGTPSGATVETLEPCRMEFLPVADLRKMLERDRKACLAVAMDLGGKLKEVMGQAELLLLSQSATEKLARLLIGWCGDNGRSEVVKMHVGLTHEEIAQMICSSRETVTRLLGEFKRSQILNLTRDGMVVRDRKALEMLARCEQ